MLSRKGLYDSFFILDASSEIKFELQPQFTDLYYGLTPDRSGERREFVTARVFYLLSRLEAIEPGGDRKLARDRYNWVAYLDDVVERLGLAPNHLYMEQPGKPLGRWVYGDVADGGPRAATEDASGIDAEPAVFEAWEPIPVPRMPGTWP